MRSCGSCSKCGKFGEFPVRSKLHNSVALGADNIQRVCGTPALATRICLTYEASATQKTAPGCT